MTYESERPMAGEQASLMQPSHDLDGENRPDVVEDGGQVFLLGVRSASSGVEAFPARPICPASGKRDMEPVRFGPDAVLYSFATVHVSPSGKVPFTLGYIDFPSGLRALAHVRVPDSQLRCDLKVVLRTDGEGDWWVELAGEAA